MYVMQPKEPRVGGGARYHGHRHYKHIMSLVLSYAYVYSDDDVGVAHSCCSYVTCNGF